LNPAKDKNPMTHDLADQIHALSLERCMTQMYLVNGESIHGVNLRRFVEARSRGEALELWARAIGFYDADPAHVVDLDSVSAIEIPATVGHCGVITGMECL
jgi:hypothetical protein